jgi:hypothetical protein
VTPTIAPTIERPTRTLLAALMSSYLTAQALIAVGVLRRLPSERR